MGSYPDRGDAQVRPRRLLFLFTSLCQLLITAILVKAQLCFGRGCLLLSCVGLRLGSSGSVAGVPRREEADKQGDNGDDRAEFHDRTVCLSAVLQNGLLCRADQLVEPAGGRCVSPSRPRASYAAARGREALRDHPYGSSPLGARHPRGGRPSPHSAEEGPTHLAQAENAGAAPRRKLSAIWESVSEAAPRRALMA